MPQKAGMPTVPPLCNGGMPPPQPRGFPGIPKSSFLACASRHLQLPSQDGRAPMLRKHSAKSLYPGRVCQWCIYGGGEGPERGWRGVVIFFYHCLALLLAADRFNCEQSHEWLFFFWTQGHVGSLHCSQLRGPCQSSPSTP